MSAGRCGVSVSLWGKSPLGKKLQNQRRCVNGRESPSIKVDGATSWSTWIRWRGAMGLCPRIKGGSPPWKMVSYLGISAISLLEVLPTLPHVKSLRMNVYRTRPLDCQLVYRNRKRTQKEVTDLPLSRCRFLWRCLGFASWSEDGCLSLSRRNRSYRDVIGSSFQKWQSAVPPIAKQFK